MWVILDMIIDRMWNIMNDLETAVQVEEQVRDYISFL